LQEVLDLPFDRLLMMMMCLYVYINSHTIFRTFIDKVAVYICTYERIKERLYIYIYMYIYIYIYIYICIYKSYKLKLRSQESRGTFSDLDDMKYLL